MKIVELIENTERLAFDIGNNIKLVNRQYSIGQESDTWAVDYEDKIIGEISLYFYSELKYPSINTIFIYDKNFRGIGLGRKIVNKLVGYYGGLCSDPQGVTSNDAVKMWIALDAEKISTDKNTKGYYFQVEK